jgi:hypothetical protein
VLLGAAAAALVGALLGELINRFAAALDGATPVRRRPPGARRANAAATA